MLEVSLIQEHVEPSQFQWNYWVQNSKIKVFNDLMIWYEDNYGICMIFRLHICLHHPWHVFALSWQLQELFQHVSRVTCTKEWRRMWPLPCHQWHSQRVRWPRCPPSLQCHKFNKSKRKPMLRFPSSIRPDPWNISEAVTSIAAGPSDCANFCEFGVLHLYSEPGKKGSSITCLQFDISDRTAR